MTAPVLVCPFQEELLARLSGRTLVITIDDVHDIPRVLEKARLHSIRVHCLDVRTRLPLTSLTVSEEWRGAPLALHVSELGRFHEVVRQLAILKQLNIRIYLPLSAPAGSAGIRILSSLGVSTAVDFGDAKPDWDQAGDLLAYALFGLRPHAPIEPFQFLISQYDQHQETDFGAVYFDEPAKYLHVNSDGRIALGRREMGKGLFFAESIDEADSLLSEAAERKKHERREKFFLMNDGCAYCQGWRVCLGTFAHTRNGANGCARFFSEVMDSIERFRSLRERKTELWQP